MSGVEWRRDEETYDWWCDLGLVCMSVMEPEPGAGRFVWQVVDQSGECPDLPSAQSAAIAAARGLLVKALAGLGCPTIEQQAKRIADLEAGLREALKRWSLFAVGDAEIAAHAFVSSLLTAPKEG